MNEAGRDRNYPKNKYINISTNMFFISASKYRKAFLYKDYNSISVNEYKKYPTTLVSLTLYTIVWEAEHLLNDEWMVILNT